MIQKNDTSECEFEEHTLESHAESIHRCYNSELKYYLKEVKKIKEMNISDLETGDGRDDTTWLANIAWCTCNSCQLYNMNAESCKHCQKDAKAT